MDFSKLFHHHSKDSTQRGEVNPGLSLELWPESWRTVHHKTYPTCKKIKLLDVSKEDIQGEKDFFVLTSKRKSRRDYQEKPITTKELSVLLKYACGTTEDNGIKYSRAHPSAGGLYPIEIYIYINKGSEGLPTGVYHYNIQEHTLDVLKQMDVTKDFLAENFTYEWVRDASICIIFTAVFDRTKQKYGERGYRYILLEAGHISQNIYLISESLGLSCTGLGGTKDVAVEKTLDIDGVNESVIYGMSLGKS